MLQKGDVLMTEGGDADKLGRGCVWDAQVAPCLHQNHIFAVRPNQSRLSSTFSLCLMGTRYARAYFQSTAKQTHESCRDEQDQARACSKCYFQFG